MMLPSKTYLGQNRDSMQTAKLFMVKKKINHKKYGENVFSIAGWHNDACTTHNL